MTHAELRNSGFPFGANCTPPADLVGGFLSGPVNGRREIKFAEPNHVAFHEADDRVDTDRETYATVYQYPKAEYVEHCRKHCSPKGYAGPAACSRIVWDIDRDGDPQAALTDARKLARFLIDRYGEDGFGCFFSGSKGYHLSVVCVPGFTPMPHTPAVVRLLALTVAKNAGVTVDSSIYDRQRLFRLPNSRHAKSGLYKRFLEPEELFRLDAARIRDIAKHPAGYSVPTVSELSANLDQDWLECEKRVLDAAASSTGFGSIEQSNAPSSSARPIVPQSVKNLIGLAEIPAPGERAIRLFSAAAALSEAVTAYGTDSLIFHLLEEAARKCGLTAAEVEKQIRDGIARGRRTQGRGEA